MQMRKEEFHTRSFCAVNEIGLAERLSQGCVRLKREQYLPKIGSSRKTDILGQVPLMNIRPYYRPDQRSPRGDARAGPIPLLLNSYLAIIKFPLVICVRKISRIGKSPGQLSARHNEELVSCCSTGTSLKTRRGG